MDSARVKPAFWRLSAGEREFARNVLTFVGGRGFAVGITFALMPVVARLFAPSDFGVAALFLGVVSTVGPLACLSFERAIPIAHDEREAQKLLLLCLALTIVVGLLTCAVTAVMAAGSWVPASMVALGGWIWLIAPCIVIEGVSTGLEAWLLRHKRFVTLGSGEVTQAFSRTGLRIAGGLALGSSLFVLVSSIALALGLKLGILLRACRDDARVTERPPTREEAAALARNFRDFPQYNFPTGLLIQATRQLPLFVLAHFFGPAAAGFFAMADRVIGTPVYIGTNTLRKVFVQKAAEIANSGRSVKPALLRTALGLAVAALVPSLLLGIFGEELATLILGARWQEAGRIIELMAPFLFVQALGAPFHGVANVTRQQKLWFKLNIITALSRVLIIPAVWLVKMHPDTVVLVYVWSTVVTLSFAMAVMYAKVDANPRRHAHA